MMDYPKKFLFYCLLLFFLILSASHPQVMASSQKNNDNSGSALCGIKKKIIVSLLSKKTVRVETSYKIEPGNNTAIASIGIDSLVPISDVTVKCNDRQFPPETYEIMSNPNCCSFIKINGLLSDYANIQKMNYFYISYKATIRGDAELIVKLWELNQISEKPVDVFFQLVGLSNEMSYRPVIISDQEWCKINNNKVDNRDQFISVASRTYKSSVYSDTPNLTPIHGLSYHFIEQTFCSDWTRTIAINENTIQESFNFKIPNRDDGSQLNLITIQFPPHIVRTDAIKVHLVLEGKQQVVPNIDYSILKESFDQKKFNRNFYSWVKNPNSNDNFLYIGFHSKKQEPAEFNLAVNYNRDRIIETDDNFFFRFSYHISQIFPKSPSGFLHIKLPEGYHVDKTNHEQMLLADNSYGSSELHFSVNDNVSIFVEPLNINFSRNEANFFRILRKIHLWVLILSPLFVVLWYFNLFHLKTFHIGTIKKWVFGIASIIYPIILSNYCTTARFKDSFLYTRSWIPIFIISVYILYIIMKWMKTKVVLKNS